MTAGSIALLACSDRKEPGRDAAGDKSGPIGRVITVVQYCEATINDIDGLGLPGGNRPLVHAEGNPCPPSAPSLAAVHEPEPQRVVMSGDVLFDFGKAVIKDAEHEELDRLAERLKRDRDTHIEVNGYTDWTGSSAYNQRLSERRARAVETYLADAGVPAAAMMARGLGKTDPAAPNTTTEGRAKNRRVEIIAQ